MQVYPDMPWLYNLIQVANPFLDFIRWIGFEILKLMAHGVDIVSDAVNGVLGVNIMNIEPVQTFATKLTPVAWAALAAAIAGAGLYMMYYQGKNKELFRNLLLSVILMVAIPFMFSTLNQFKDASVTDMKGQLSGGGSPGQSILQTAVIDVGNSTKGVATLDSKINPYYIDINSRLPGDGIWQYKIDYVTGNDKTGYKMYGSTLGGGFFGWGADTLYNYSYDFFMPFFTLLITLVAMCFAGFKMGRTMYDLVFHQIIAPVVFATDVNNGARTKKFIQNLVGLYVMILLILMVIKIFVDISGWLTLNVSNPLIKIFLLGGSAWGVIDGPDLVIKLLGIDAGVRSATSVILGANAAAGILGRGAGGVAAAVGVGSKVAGAASAAPHLISNIKSGIADAAGGGLGTAAEYGHALSKNAQGARGFAAGQMRTSNAAKKFGYALGKIPEVTDDQPGQGESPSPLADADRATAGNPVQSVEAAAYETKKFSPETEQLLADLASEPEPVPMETPATDVTPSAPAEPATEPAAQESLKEILDRWAPVSQETPAAPPAEAPAKRTPAMPTFAWNADVTQKAAEPVVQNSDRVPWPSRKERGDH